MTPRIIRRKEIADLKGFLKELGFLEIPYKTLQGYVGTGEIKRPLRRTGRYVLYGFRVDSRLSGIGCICFLSVDGKKAYRATTGEGGLFFIREQLGRLAEKENGRGDCNERDTAGTAQNPA